MPVGDATEGAVLVENNRTQQVEDYPWTQAMTIV
jgi:hypothetical protein